MSAYQEVELLSVETDARAVTIRVVEVSPDTLCIGSLWTDDCAVAVSDDESGQPALFAAQILIDRSRGDGEAPFYWAIAESEEVDDPARAAAVIESVQLLERSPHADTSGDAGPRYEALIRITLTRPEYLGGFTVGARWSAVASLCGELFV